MMIPPRWPNDHKFAFTIFDDTDCSTLANTKPVYDLLQGLGFRTTKSVWPIKGAHKPLLPGDTCEDDGYRAWTLQLQRAGFEIGIHNATYHSSIRAETERALDAFKQIYGHDPKVGANHAYNEDSVYWGRHRLTGLNSLFYSALKGFRKRNFFRGHIPGDEYFWGDLCRDRIAYYRNFVFNDINSLASCPMMPYHDPLRPYVRQWFASSEGADIDAYVKMLCEENQDKLQAQSGLCIIYTHFGKGFCEHGRLDSRFARLMRRLADKGGWYAPVGEVLDYLREQRGEHVVSDEERRSLERRWLADKLLATKLPATSAARRASW